jgi:hypothetical protein
VNGRACTNSETLRLDVANEKILGTIRNRMLSPERITSMAKKLQGRYMDYQRTLADRQEQAPKALQELDARLARLRDRLRTGDPDMTADELQAAIETAERKRAALADEQPSAKESARILAMLPQAAKLCRDQIENGLAGDERAQRKARITLKDLLGGPVRLTPGEEGGSLWAQCGNRPAALLKTAVGGYGSGGAISLQPTDGEPLLRWRVK